MKILIINKFLYPRGGDCIHALALGKLLREAGHEVRFYAMNYPQNAPCDDIRFFAEEVSFHAAGLSGKAKAAARVLWGKGVKQGFEELLNEFCPDIVHLHNIHSYLSPVVARLAHRQGIKVLWTLHDYKLLCPSYNCLCKGKICEACFVNKKEVLFRKCMKNSLSASALGWAEAVAWSRDKLSKWSDTFICPSQFMAEKMLQGGYPKDKLQVIHNFMEDEQASRLANAPTEREQSYAYIGRLSEEKGLESLLQAALRLPYKLYIAGAGPLKEALMQKYASDKIVFLGHLPADGIKELLNKVSFTVIPSIWYENNPISVIESLCCGTPVIGREMGGIPELLASDSCNRLFKHDNELPALIDGMFASAASVNREELAHASRQRFSGAAYYQKWLEIAESK